VKVFAAIALAAACALPAQAASTRTARVAVTDLSPFTVHGWRFLPHEHVRVVVRVEGTYVHTPTASAAGTFTTRFSALRVGSCTPYWVRATGDEGSTALLRVMPECPPPTPV